MNLLKEAADHVTSPIKMRLNAASEWYRNVAKGSEAALDAAADILGLLEIAVAQGRSLDTQHDRLAALQTSVANRQSITACATC